MQQLILKRECSTATKSIWQLLGLNSHGFVIFARRVGFLVLINFEAKREWLIIFVRSPKVTFNAAVIVDGQS